MYTITFVDTLFILFQKLIDPYACNDDCELIRQRLTSALIDRHLSYAPLNDTGPAEVEEGGSGKVDNSATWRGSGGCYLGRLRYICVVIYLI